MKRIEIDGARLMQMYERDRLTTREIARQLGVSQWVVVQRLRSMGIKARKASQYLPSLQERFMRSVNKTDSCWLWAAALDSGGYGKSSVARKTKLAHRVSYEMFVGPIPDGLQIDHLCRVRNCVNPAHLEPVTAKENQRRGCGPVSINAAKQACHRGHAFSHENLYVTREGRRQCRACRREAQRRFSEKPEAASCL